MNILECQGPSSHNEFFEWLRPFTSVGASSGDAESDDD